MDEQHYRHLVKRYLDGKATDDELEVFIHLLGTGVLDNYFKQVLDEESTGAEEPFVLPAAQRKKRVLPMWFKYAAAVLLFSSISVKLFLDHFRKPEKAQATNTIRLKNDALPGGNKAILTLANGKKIVLGKSAQGTIARQGASQVEKIKEGHLVYQASDSLDQSQAETMYNTVSTPKGGQYAITLADGTSVWLNSMSSITFPTAFKGNERKVITQGEVYFEVAKDKAKPFTVESNGQMVKVLGTHFNINAYNDEGAIRTTLLEGSIAVTGPSGTKVLVPGQQSEVTDRYINIVSGADVQAAVAWKNGNFNFNNTDLPTLMRQLARWYDINIIYTGKVSEHEFMGQIKRSVRLSSVLKILQASGVRCNIDGKNLYIRP
ncbi:FecR domain-containing protein [Mucilaginibacter sp. RS28]|uniref:FecR domain-containing protein n=1 Tax=Mucilaginibacter straminoryzae TaxID=2932774 RepID=A0A9X1X7X0_9SPHI|nr:FecR family protein [Mucilaginibacter straminoryzae]MCJ8211333.1 FecR domain-containing protein [Mucilaginibacter straminoryzae]